MKKLLAIMLGFAIGLTVFGAAYESDTFESVDQSNDGRVLVKYFSYATDTVAHATNDTIILTDIPANARIIGGAINVSAMGGAQTLDLGIKGTSGAYITGTTANDPDLFLDGIALTNAVADTFADARQGDANANYELGELRVYLYCTALGAAWTTNETITGWVKYIEP